MVLLGGRALSVGCPTTTEYNPVCGSDGRNYSNPGQAACSGITNFQSGPCPDTPIGNRVIPSQDVSINTLVVPGSGNSNLAEIVPPPDVSIGTPVVPSGRPCISTRERNPVCGSNRVTYSNPSVARCAGITSFVPGECQNSGSSGPCPVTMNIAHVCGSDNVTYINASAARCNGITIFRMGKCEDLLINQNCPVTANIAYVCGSNGTTYVNASEARCKGITQFTPGRCADFHIGSSMYN